MFIAAQILGVVVLLITIGSFFAKKRIPFIICNTTVNFILGIHYFLLNSPSAGFLCLFATVRYLIYMLKDKYKIFSGIWIPIIFILCNLIISFFTFNNWYDILPTMSAIILCITPWFNNIIIVKIGSLSVSPLWIVFDVIVKAWVALFMEIITFITTLTIFIILLVKGKKQKLDANN